MSFNPEREMVMMMIWVAGQKSWALEALRIHI